VARSIMEQINSDAPLSRILSQIRAIASMNNDPVTVALVDLLIHGLQKVPYQKPPFTDPAYRNAVIKYSLLCSTQDFSKQTVNGVIESLKNAGHKEFAAQTKSSNKFVRIRDGIYRASSVTNIWSWK